MRLNQAIIKTLLERYASNPITVGIILFGSAVRGEFDTYSDIDVYILQKNKPRYGRESFKLQDARIDIILNGTKEAWDYLKKEKYSVYRNTSHMLAYGKIIYAQGPFIIQVQRAAINNLRLKTRFSHDESLMHLYSINDFYGEVRRYAKKMEVFAFEQSCALLVNNALEFFLKLKGEYFRRPNELAPVIRRRDASFAQALLGFYRARSIQTKLNFLSALVNRIHKLAGTSLPDTWKVR